MPKCCMEKYYLHEYVTRKTRQTQETFKAGLFKRPGVQGAEPPAGVWGTLPEGLTVYHKSGVNG